MPLDLKRGRELPSLPFMCQSSMEEYEPSLFTAQPRLSEAQSLSPKREADYAVDSPYHFPTQSPYFWAAYRVCAKGLNSPSTLEF